MKNNKKPKKLLTLLVLYFGVLSTLLMSLFIFINKKTIDILSQNYWGRNYSTIIDYMELLEKGKFDEIPVKSLLGRKGYFDIVDENNKIVYSSGEIHNYTQKDIENFDSLDSIY